LLRAGNPPERALRIMAHILGASWLWYSRLIGQPSPVTVWPDFDVHALAAELNKLHRVWERHLAALSPERLSNKVEYVNTKGERWTSTVEDVLTHLFMHSAYHRGQIAVLLRIDRHEPAYTDYIHAARQKLI
jgi:uncharacterized damage-inducible protein DinB